MVLKDIIQAKERGGAVIFITLAREIESLGGAQGAAATEEITAMMEDGKA